LRLHDNGQAPFSDKISTHHVRTITGNKPVIFEVHSFNYFFTLGLTFTVLWVTFLYPPESTFSRQNVYSELFCTMGVFCRCRR